MLSRSFFPLIPLAALTAGCGPVLHQTMEDKPENERYETLASMTTEQLCSGYNNVFLKPNTEKQILEILKERHVDKCTARGQTRIINSEPMVASPTLPATTSAIMSPSESSKPKHPEVNSGSRVDPVQTQQPQENIHVSVFGIPLGGHMDVSECDKYTDSFGIQYKVSGNIKAPCFRRSHGQENRSGPPLEEFVYLDFPINDRPFGYSHRVHFVNGTIQFIGFGTRGLKVQDSYLDRLKEKFGEPHITPIEIATLAGGKFPTFIAVWKKDGYTVVYSAVTLEIDQGEVKIFTEVGEKAEDNRMKRLLGKPGRQL